MSSEKQGDKTLACIMTKHHNPTPLEIAQRYKFHGRFCQPGESVDTSVAELHSLAEFCNFQQTMDDMLRDRAAIQRCLLAGPRLTFQVLSVSYQHNHRHPQSWFC